MTFNQPPPATSIFAGQKRLKLYTHCRPNEGFQQYVLLEYAGYRLHNLLTPFSFRARLLQVDYSNTAGKPLASRVGFFLEDLEDVARRNGMTEAKVGPRTQISRLSPPEAARFALFEYLISNLDWAMQAGPAGDNCCHNGRLVAPNGAASPILVPIPYDWDFSGFVDAPYATPPEAIKVGSVRVRRYRGFCRHNAEALTAAREIYAKRPQFMATLAATPGLDQRTIGKASAFLERGFADIATDQGVTENLLKTCVG